MNTRSAKNKGVRLQNYVRDKLLEKFPELTGQITCAIMGESGEDIKLTDDARKQIPFSFECKARGNGLSLAYDALDQAKSNAKGNIPIGVFKADRKKPIAILDLDDLAAIILLLNDLQEK